MTPRATGLWMTLAAAALFAVGAVVAAGIFDLVGPAGVAQMRAVVAALVAAVIAYRRRSTSSGGRLPMLALLGCLLAAVTFTFYVAIERLGVGPGTTIQFTGPILVMAWTRLVDRHHFPPAAWLAAGAAVIGTAVMTEAWRGDLDVVGVLAAGAAAVIFAAYLVVGARLGRTLPAVTVMAYGFAFSALIWVIAAPVDWARYDLEIWWRLVFIGVVGTTVPFLLEMAALRRANPGLVGVVATAEPVIGAILAWAFLDQVLTPTQTVGATITVAAIAAVQLLATRH